MYGRDCFKRRTITTPVSNNRFELSQVLNFLNECFSDPSEAVPTMDKDEAADVFVEGEDSPHGHETPAETYAEYIASDHLYAPHDDDS